MPAEVADYQNPSEKIAFVCLVIPKSPVKLDHAFNCCCSLSPLQAMAKVTVNRFLAAVGRLMQW